MRLESQLKQMREATMERMPQSIMQVFKDSIDEIRRNQLKRKALQIGDYVPDMELTGVHGETMLLSALQKKDFLILNFYRGGWCPYCNMELREYERLRNDFNILNTDIVGISAEVMERASQTIDKNALSFPVLTDVNAQLMKAIGIVFQLDEASKQEYNNFGINLNQIHGNNSFELPVPAIYVIDKERKIVYAHFEEDYMTRLEPTTLLDVVKNNLNTKKNTIS